MEASLGFMHKRPRIETPSSLPTFKVRKKIDIKIVSKSKYVHTLATLTRPWFATQVILYSYHILDVIGILASGWGLEGYSNLIGDSYYLDQVRKEKLGDRVTALQQLVSPFGKVNPLSFYNPFFFLTYYFYSLSYSFVLSTDWYRIRSSWSRRVHQIFAWSSQCICS